LYDHWDTDRTSLLATSADADVVIVGSYYPDAIAATCALAQSLRCPVLFYDIDTPITLNHLRADGRTQYLCATSIPTYAAYLSFTGGPALTELEERFGARRAVAFFCSVDSELYRPTPVSEAFRCDLSYLGTYASDRQSNLMKLLDGAAMLLPEQSFLVAGSQYPADVIWQENVQRMIHVPPQDHAAFYSSSRFTLNLTRDDMVNAGYSPSVRLFEASACGAAIVSDVWAGLADFLTPGEEILLPKDAYEMAQVLTGISDEDRLAIGRRAQQRILDEHTANHRAIELEGIIADL
jgi:spore maturation protein CgeB